MEIRRIGLHGFSDGVSETQLWAADAITRPTLIGRGQHSRALSPAMAEQMRRRLRTASSLLSPPARAYRPGDACGKESARQPGGPAGSLPGSPFAEGDAWAAADVICANWCDRFARPHRLAVQRC